METKHPGFNPPIRRNLPRRFPLLEIVEGFILNKALWSTVIVKPQGTRGLSKKQAAALLEDSTKGSVGESMCVHKNMQKIWVQQASAVKSFRVKDSRP